MPGTRPFVNGSLLLAESRGVGRGDCLGTLERIATRAGAEGVAREAGELAARVGEGRFYVACVGQFKRGKSTVLNALVGYSVLPTGVVPVTSALTVLRWGAQQRARVSFDDGSTREVSVGDVGRFVTEAENPENEKGVRAVEVFLPSPLLSRGMCFVDTPGLGSVFGGNAAVTRAFVPQIDAAIVVLGADPPISGEELDLVQAVSTQVRHVLFVLNKADRLTEQERVEGARFAVHVLSRRLGRASITIHEVSAAERIAASAPTRDWGALEQAVDALAHEAGADLVAVAESRGAERLARSLLRELAERREALIRPMEESERRLEILRRSVAEAERAANDVGVLLAAERSRLTSDFRERQAVFYPRARDGAIRELEARIRSLDVSRARLRSRGYVEARALGSRTVERWRTQIEPLAEDLYRRAADRFVALANDFLRRTAESGAPGMEDLPRAIEPQVGFRARSELFYTNLMYLTTQPIGWALDLVRPREGTVRAVVGRAGEYLDRLLESNTSRIATDLGERVARSAQRLEGELRAALRNISGMAERALELARQRRAEGEAAVRAEIEMLEDLGQETESLLSSHQSEERA
ncbi:MAG TPA: dynamin family protein [Thermoanaerobaculaceae bacterium]|nr:dynamin family protein [Thermoanaerobaculaceae bacterium]